MALAQKSGLCQRERQKEENGTFDRFSEVVRSWHSNQKLNIHRVQVGSILK